MNVDKFDKFPLENKEIHKKTNTKNEVQDKFHLQKICSQSKLDI